MKNCIFIGTCQVFALASILKNVKTFSNEYDIKKIIQVHSYSIEEMDNLIKNIQEIDLIICQPISQTYRKGLFSTHRLLESIDKNKTKIVMLPFAYFDGYFPSICYLKDEMGNKIEKNKISYHDNNILKHLMERIDIDKSGLDSYLYLTHDENFHLNRITNILNEKEYYNKSICERNVIESLKKLEFREKFPYDYNKSVDIKISDFIKDNFRKIRLFHTMNHPTNYLLYELTKRILTFLELDYSNFNFEMKEILNDSDFHIYPSIIKNLNLNFNSQLSINKYLSLYFKDIKVSTLLFNYLS